MNNMKVVDPKVLSTTVLFPAEERWGWRFRYLSTATHPPYPENCPYPTMPQLPDETSFLKVQATRRRWLIFLAIAVFVVFFISAALSLLKWQLVDLGVLAAAAILIAGIWLSHRAYLQFKKQSPVHQSWAMNYAAHLQNYEELHQQWQRNRNEYENDFRRKIDASSEWGVLRPRRTTGRVDVYGGSPFEWEALIVTLGASILGTGSCLSIIDLSQSGVASALYHRTKQHGFSAWKLSLPEQQEDFNLLAALSPIEVTDMLVEALHSDDKEENKEGRSIDTRIIKGICQCLSQPLTIQRIHAGLLVLLRQGRDLTLLKNEERTKIFDLFQEDYLTQIRQRLVALESQLYDLRQIGEQSNVEDGSSQNNHALRILKLSAAGATLDNDIFVSFLVQRQIRLLRSQSQEESGTHDSVLMIAGVDNLKPKLLERLDNLSKRHGIRLIYLFEHLRRDALELLGGSNSTVVFMRLGNAKEAAAAAEFIGRGYKFVMKGFSENEGENESRNIGYSTGVNKSVGVSKSAQWLSVPSHSISSGVSMATNAGESLGTNKGTSQSHERVYEFEVEPTFLQSLPTTSLLLVEQGNFVSGQPVQLIQEGGRRVQIGYCDPDILLLPRVSPDPFPSWEDRGQRP